MPHIYTQSIQAGVCPLGPHPGATHTSPAYRQRQAACLGGKRNQVSCTWGSRCCRLEVRAQLSSDQVLEKKYTPLRSHTRGERGLVLPPALTHVTREEGSRREEGCARKAGLGDPPWPLSCCPPCLVAHLARGVRSQGTRATTNLEAPCSPHLGLKPKGGGGLGFCFLKRKSENKHNYNQNHKNNDNKRCHQPPSIKLQPLEMTKNITFQGPEAALCTEGGWWGPHKRTHKKRLRQESTSTFCMFFYLLQVGSELSLARTLDFFSDPTARSPQIG